MIHSAIVAAQSPALATLVNGPMQEAIEGKANWDSIDENTFVSFWQHAYSGDYNIDDDPTAPETSEVIEAPFLDWDEEVKVNETNNEPQIDDHFRGTCSLKKNSKRDKSRRTPLNWERLNRGQLWARFLSFRRSQNLNSNPLWRETIHEATREGDSLVHAKIYVFADCYGILQLMELSYNKLHQSLVDIYLHSERLSDIVALAQYCYDTPAPEDLKELVVLFIACEVETLWEVEAFQDLLEAHSDLSKEVIGLLRSRLT
ncbi:BTB/POZ fold protein [Moelleriella libera RCEF 2490]|uniref:BTB/POZ fold protein n=1 Tax=Moelleriella libera RCEF 2490 TaxID=1081109 RepID=A0A162IJF2_9HYPO|nr:BTB/POZ fold protein [Moelleriella libera RCEF 2490]